MHCSALQDPIVDQIRISDLQFRFVHVVKSKDKQPINEPRLDFVTSSCFKVHCGALRYWVKLKDPQHKQWFCSGALPNYNLLILSILCKASDRREVGELCKGELLLFYFDKLSNELSRGLSRVSTWSWFPITAITVRRGMNKCGSWNRFMKK